MDHLLKTKKEFKNSLKETGDTKYIYRNELNKACFQHDMADGDFKTLQRRTASDKVLRDKTFNIAENPKYDGYQKGLTSMVLWFYDILLWLIKRLWVVVLNLCQISNWLRNFINQLLENF